MSSELEQFQLDCAARLGSSFSDIAVFVERPRSASEAVLLQTRLEDALSGQALTGGKCGVTCTVRMPSAEVPEPNLPGPVFDAAIIVRVIENPAINMGPSGTGRSAEDVALAVIGALHQFVIENVAITAGQEALKPAAPAAGRITYDCRFSRRFALPPQARVAPVSISVSGSQISLACATAGASIRYSLDGGYPSPSAESYSASFTVSGPCKVRAAAYLAGFSGSNVTAVAIL